MRNMTTENSGVWVSVKDAAQITKLPDYLIKQWAVNGFIQSTDRNYASCKIYLPTLFDAIELVLAVRGDF